MVFGKKKTVVLAISGMHCERCAAKAEKALKELGCKAVVELAAGKATVTAPEKLNNQEIAAAVTRVGFPASVCE